MLHKSVKSVKKENKPVLTMVFLGNITLLKIHINSWFFFFFLTLKISAGKPLPFFSKYSSAKRKGLALSGCCFQTWSISRAASEISVLFAQGCQFYLVGSRGPVGNYQWVTFPIWLSKVLSYTTKRHIFINIISLFHFFKYIYIFLSVRAKITQHTLC